MFFWSVAQVEISRCGAGSLWGELSMTSLEISRCGEAPLWGDPGMTSLVGFGLRNHLPDRVREVGASTSAHLATLELLRLREVQVERQGKGSHAEFMIGRICVVRE